MGKMPTKKKTEKCKNSNFWLSMDFMCTNFSSFSDK